MLEKDDVQRYVIPAVLSVKFANLPQMCELSVSFRSTLNKSS